MDPVELAQTVYLGDRGCKSLLLDGWSDRILIQVYPAISRIRDQSGEWRFYAAEDILDGLLVFSGIHSFSFNPLGRIPNDEIVSFSAEEYEMGDRQEKPRLYMFKLCIVSIGEERESDIVCVEIVAEQFHLEDPKEPTVQIRG